MQLWRLCQLAYANDAFSGIGAEQTGGRWNFKGRRVAYCSEHLSLAILEMLVHVDASCLPTDLVSIRAELPDSVSQEVLRATDLPADWRDYPAPASLKKLGADWIANQASLVLRVPSVVAPQESNLLVNPAHAEFSQLKVVDVQPFQIDSRVLKT